jgi:hypothetical protein
MEIKEYVNKWMSTDLIYWKDFNGGTNNLRFVNEEDRKFITNEGYFFGKCIGTIEEYLIFYNGSFTLRILPKLVRNIYPTPKFEWGDKVQEVKRPEINGEIINLVWHYKDQEYKYFIKVNGKPKSRRYNPDELILQNLK